MSLFSKVSSRPLHKFHGSRKMFYKLRNYSTSSSFFLSFKFTHFAPGRFCAAARLVLLVLLETLQTVHVNLSTLPCWRWEVESRAGAGVAALCSLWLRRRRRERIQSPAVGGLVH